MDRRQSESRKVNRRYRRAAERLWENSSLRDDMNDDQAARMLDWGSAYLKEAAEKTADLPDDEADKILETKTERVSGVIRQVNETAKAIRKDDQQELLAHYMLLARKLVDLLDLPEDSSKSLEKRIFSSEEYSDQMIDEVISLVHGEEE